MADSVNWNKSVKNDGLTIARAVLDLGSERGAGLAEHVANLYRENPVSYVARLEAIMRKAVEEKADMLLLPTAALIWRKKGERNSYNNAAKKITYVVGGELRLPMKGDKREYSPRTVIWQKGEWVGQIDPGMTYWLLGGAIFSVVAAELTLGHAPLVGYPYPKDREPWVETGFIVLRLLLYHHAEKYSKPLLEVVHSLTKHPRKLAIILAFWKRTESPARVFCMRPQKKSKFTFQRHSVPYGSGNNREDYIDIVRFKKMKVEK